MLGFSLDNKDIHNITIDEMKEIERLEKTYLDEINFLISHNIDKIMEDLDSKDLIREDWINRTDKSVGELARGAERIFFNVFSQFGVPNSSPVGADLFYETCDAFIHIDIKSVQKKNKQDFKWKLAIEKNQTSYKGIVIPTKGEFKGQQREYEGNLPYYYTKSNGKKKICLTYFIAIFYDIDTLDIEWIKLVCMPNGLLYPKYGDDILQCGKNVDKSRYTYRNNSKFILLEDEPSRINVVYWNNDMDEKLKKYFKNLKNIYDNRDEL